MIERLKALLPSPLRVFHAMTILVALMLLLVEGLFFAQAREAWHTGQKEKAFAQLVLMLGPAIWLGNMLLQERIIRRRVHIALAHEAYMLGLTAAATAEVVMSEALATFQGPCNTCGQGPRPGEPIIKCLAGHMNHVTCITTEAVPEREGHVTRRCPQCLPHV